MAAKRRQIDSALERIIDLRHPDPHSFLGLHEEGSGLVVRVFRPNAQRVRVLKDSGESLEMRHVEGGMFEVHLPNESQRFPYRVEVTYPDGRTVTARDPYSFWPTLGELDVYLLGEGSHRRLWEKLGSRVLSHEEFPGVAFSIWAPTAEGVSVVGDFNSWDGRTHAMRRMGNGVWEIFIPDVREGARYKFEIRPRQQPPFLKSDPVAFRAEVPPATASIVSDLHQYHWSDQAWLQARARSDLRRSPVSIYEVHWGSWRRVVEESNRPLSYRELAPVLADYVVALGFTHVELLPLAEHPFGGSWGYQVTSYFAPTSRYGRPDDLRFFIDYLHQRGIGVIIDWVPGHFPRDAHGLARLDGTALYEHEDPRQGAHPDWGTLVFNFGRHEVRNFLIANALFWIEEYHFDGLRVDAVASMLYLDYSRKPGEWIPNRSGGRENEDAIVFLCELNELIRNKHPGVAVIAEESTAWPKITGHTNEGGLGFEFKWNMGWMHDTLLYFTKDPIYRRFHHSLLTFGLLYAFSEHFILPLSHDEVVHGKGSLYGKMLGDISQKMANLRALFAWMWAHPGKKLLFMGAEFGQISEWNHERSLDWHLLEDPLHAGVSHLVADLNRRYTSDSALYEVDADPQGFQWLQADSADSNVYAFIRRGLSGEHMICVANLSPVARYGYRVGAPELRDYAEILNTDAQVYGGSGTGNAGRVAAIPFPADHQPASLELTLPPLGVIWFQPA